MTYQIDNIHSDCEGGIIAIKFHPDLNRIYCTGKNGILQSSFYGNNMTVKARSMCKIYTKAIVNSFEIINEFNDGKIQLFCGCDDGKIRIYQETMIAMDFTLKLTETFSAFNPISIKKKMKTLWSSEFKYLYTANHTHCVKIFDCNKDNKLLGKYNTNCNMVSMIGNHLDRNLLVVGCNDNTLRLFDLRTNINTNNNLQEIAITQQHGTLFSVQSTHKQSTYCYYLCSDKELMLFDIRNSSTIVRTESNPTKRKFTVFASHRLSPIYALGIRQHVDVGMFRLQINAEINQNYNKLILNSIYFYDGFIGPRIQPINVIEFHPEKQLMGIGSQDKSLLLCTDRNKLT